MRTQRCSLALIVTAICISAGSNAAANDAPGIVRVSDRQQAPIQQTSFSNSCESCEYCGKGCGRGGATLFDCLFGCMTPSGACGQGAPLFGKYQITYADKPAYSDPRDGQAWAAQGYGMPMTVPAAPVVRYSYNYSHGTPASRLTPLSTYNPATGPRSLYLQSWH